MVGKEAAALWEKPETLQKWLVPFERFTGF
jgi:hypothetical protein